MGYLSSQSTDATQSHGNPVPACDRCLQGVPSGTPCMCLSPLQPARQCAHALPKKTTLRAENRLHTDGATGWETPLSLIYESWLINQVSCLDICYLVFWVLLLSLVLFVCLFLESSKCYPSLSTDSSFGFRSPVWWDGPPRLPPINSLGFIQAGLSGPQCLPLKPRNGAPCWFPSRARPCLSQAFSCYRA